MIEAKLNILLNNQVQLARMLQLVFGGNLTGTPSETRHAMDLLCKSAELIEARVDAILAYEEAKRGTAA